MAARPLAEAKELAWRACVDSDELPNAMLDATMAGLMQPEQPDLLRPYRDEYFGVVDEIWSTRSTEMAALIATHLYPSLLAEPYSTR